ncbi:MAG: twin-arginine translocase TatA/TatE family subunit [Candidatus Promineifilaceae bacterium]
MKPASWVVQINFRNRLGKEIFEMAGLGVPELLIILAVVLLVFGVGRISKIGSELGKGISAFREGVRDSSKEEDEQKNSDIEA